MDEITVLSAQCDNMTENKSMRGMFVTSLVIGAILIPALDALSLRLQQASPNLKKKKGSAPQEVQDLDSKIWQPLKKYLKAV